MALLTFEDKGIAFLQNVGSQSTSDTVLHSTRSESSVVKYICCLEMLLNCVNPEHKKCQFY